jgi:alkylhydroperoxidase/carboxymuconolactone decarboxylase family protein YurZ
VSPKAKELLIMRPIELLYIIALIALGCEDLVVLNCLCVNSVHIVEALFGIYDIQQEELIGFIFYCEYIEIY